jgi:hypothetical protein
LFQIVIHNRVTQNQTRLLLSGGSKIWISSRMPNGRAGYGWGSPAGQTHQNGLVLNSEPQKQMPKFENERIGQGCV